MTPYALQKKKVPEQFCEALQLAREFMFRVPDKGAGDDGWSCHALTRVFHEDLPHRLMKRLDLQDGYFGGKWAHTWLSYAVGDLRNPLCGVLDIYPVACVSGPLLIDWDRSPWSLLYQKMALSEMGTQFQIDVTTECVELRKVMLLENSSQVSAVKELVP